MISVKAKQRYNRAQQAELKFNDVNDCSFNAASAIEEVERVGININDVTGRVLDIGGGQGHFTSIFTNASERIVVDPLFEKIGVSLEGITGISCVGEQLPFQAKSFDFVILRNVVDHMLEPERLLREAYRVLKLGGKIYFMVNVFLPFFKPLFPLMNIIDKPHPLHFTLNDVRKLLTKDVGVRIETERIAPSMHFKWNLKRVVGMMIKKEYYAILC